MSPAVTQCLQVFARVPQPGRVKTRLIPALGPRGATAVYRALLASTLDAAAGSGADRLQIWLDRTPGRDDALANLGAGALQETMHTTLHTQCDGDIGIRMHDAIVLGLSGADRVVLIGSDCPQITAAYLYEAFAALDGCDAVIGPAADGGYVLIGLRGPAPSLFNSIPWSTADVITATRARLQQLGWCWRELATLHDVDAASDLERFPELRSIAIARTVPDGGQPRYNPAASKCKSGNPC